MIRIRWIYKYGDDGLTDLERAKMANEYRRAMMAPFTVQERLALKRKSDFRDD